MFSKLEKSLIANRQPQTFQLSVDGTSSVGKSTILQFIEEHYSQDLVCVQKQLAFPSRLFAKVQTLVSFHGINSCVLTQLGYVAAGFINSKNDWSRPFCDRHFMNCIDWVEIWSLLKKTQKVAEDLNTDDVNLVWEVFGEQFDQICETFISDPSYQALQEHVNPVIIVDSNSSRCNQLRLARNNGEDANRSVNVPFYSDVQTRAYKKFAPAFFIDKADFDYLPELIPSDFIAGVAWALVKLSNIMYESVQVIPIGISDKTPTPLDCDLLKDAASQQHLWLIRKLLYDSNKKNEDGTPLSNPMLKEKDFYPKFRTQTVVRCSQEVANFPAVHKWVGDDGWHYLRIIVQNGHFLTYDPDIDEDEVEDPSGLENLCSEDTDFSELIASVDAENF